MRPRGSSVLVVAALVVAGLAPGAAGAHDVSIGIHVGVPPPPAVVVSPPLVVVPGTPVLHAPSLAYPYFVYGGRAYTRHRGVWFTTTAPGHPWTALAVAGVPVPVLAVPVAYHKVPPGHARKAAHPGKGKGKGKGRED